MEETGALKDQRWTFAHAQHALLRTEKGKKKQPPTLNHPRNAHTSPVVNAVRRDRERTFPARSEPAARARSEKPRFTRCVQNTIVTLSSAPHAAITGRNNYARRFVEKRASIKNIDRASHAKFRSEGKGLSRRCLASREISPSGKTLVDDARPRTFRGDATSGTGMTDPNVTRGQHRNDFVRFVVKL